jgi:hypothetical protein
VTQVLPGADPLISITDIARLAKCTRGNVYWAASRHPGILPLDPNRKGVPASYAYAWLQLRAERAAAIAAAALRRHDLQESKRAARGAAKQAAREALVERLRQLQREGLARLHETYEAERAKAGGK